MRTPALILSVLGVACAEPALEPVFDLELSADGSRIDGRFVEGDAAMTFHAEELADRDGTTVALDLGERSLEIVLDRSNALLTEDAHGAMFTATDRELMQGLRDHLLAAGPEVLESTPGQLLTKVADRYAEVPLDRPRVRLDTRLNAPQQEGKADIAPGACGDDGVTCLDGTYGSSWAAYAINNLCQASQATFGDSACRGRCGFGCNWFDEDYTWDCFDHDICLDHSSDCSDEFDDAADDWIATNAPYCWSGTNRPKPKSVSLCGNSVIEAGEACDDGNKGSCDGCSATCQVEPKPAEGVKVYDHCDARDSLASGDWRPYSYKAQCSVGAPVTGWSKATHAGNGGAAHAALCRQQSTTKYPQDACRTAVFVSGNDRGTTETGDWDFGYYKGECKPGEYIAGISQRAAGLVTDAILCCQGVGLQHSSCTAHVFHGGNSRGTQSTGDWDFGYWKGECGEGFYAAGVSSIPATCAPHSVLCCQ